jgi:4-alpha-glucanotransferase
LKGDLPIGIFKHSTDAWIAPHLFNMDGQAGAPPDPFSATGQNWGFPTYNWTEMAKDGYKWWKNRMILLAKYFGAYRIDHILGFFRIWEIPSNQVDGLLGVFNPALPILSDDFIKYGIPVDEQRFCKPYLKKEWLITLFKEDTGDVITTFFEEDNLGGYQFKPLLHCQKDLEAFLNSPSGLKFLPYKEVLFQLICEVLFIKDKHLKNAYHPRINLMNTFSFKALDAHTQYIIQKMHDNYFYQMQDDFWREMAMEKLPTIKEATNMLICGEDLGMVPACVSGVMRELGLLTLEIQRMSKNPNTEFLQEKDIPFLSVVSPSTHDMSPIRTWWEESERDQIQRFYQFQLGMQGEAPLSCSPEIVEKVIDLHLRWPSIWAVFPIQDLLGMDWLLRNPNPSMERINVPANPKNYWQYRMHITIEDLLERTDFSQKLTNKIRYHRNIMVN